MYFQVCLCKLILTLIILHSISCLCYLGNKVKEKIEMKEEVIFLSMAFFCFLTKKKHLNIILISLEKFFSVPAKSCAFHMSDLSETKKTWIGFPPAFSCSISCH